MIWGPTGAEQKSPPPQPQAREAGQGPPALRRPARSDLRLAGGIAGLLAGGGPLEVAASLLLTPIRGASQDAWPRARRWGQGDGVAFSGRPPRLLEGVGRKVRSAPIPTAPKTGWRERVGLFKKAGGS